MKKKLLGLSVLMIGLAIVSTSWAGSKATPQEVIAKVREAAALIEKKGAAALPEFKKGSKWVWKDTYVFVLEKSKGTVAAHPIKPSLVGKNLMGLKDIKGNMFFAQFFEAAAKPHGGWVVYWWPKPGEKVPSRKITYVLQAGNTPYQVAAGIYDDKYTPEELDKMLK